MNLLSFCRSPSFFGDWAVGRANIEPSSEGTWRPLVSLAVAGRYNAAMNGDTLAEFLEKLSSCGQMVRVGVETDVDLEIAEVSRRVTAVGGPAILYERPTGHETAVATGLFASEARLNLALRCDSVDEVVARLVQQPDIEARRNWFSRLTTSTSVAPIDRFAPNRSRRRPASRSSA